MTRPWIVVLAIMSNLLVNVSHGQQQGQAGVPAVGGTESEISTKDSNTAIKVEVKLVLVPVVVKDSTGDAVPCPFRLEMTMHIVWDNAINRVLSVPLVTAVSVLFLPKTS